MKKLIGIGVLAAWLWSAVPPAAVSQVVFNEILYHAASGNRADEFVELYNPTSQAVDLTAWQITNGIRFLFPPGTTLGPESYLIVADSPEKLKTHLPADVDLLGPFKKKLSHKADRLELRRPDGHLVDSVAYEDNAPWPKEADGKGPSLELVNPAAPRNEPSAWRASKVPGGTPGRQNSVYDPAATLWLGGGAHSPLVPTSHDKIVLSVDSTGTTLPRAVRAEWWIDGKPKHNRLDLSPAAGTPNRWKASIGPFPDKTMIEYRFRAEGDAGVSGAVFPSVRVNEPEGYLVQVDDAPVTGTVPVYRLLVRKKDWDTLLSRPLMSNVLLPGAFIGDGVVRQRVRFRYRGKSARLSAPRKSYLIRFPPFDEFLDHRNHVFNADYFEGQFVSLTLLAQAGIIAPKVNLVGLRINGKDTGHYCWMEEIDKDFARYHFDNPDRVRIWEGKHNADLSFHGLDPKEYKGYKPTAPDKNISMEPVIALCNALRPHRDMRQFEYNVRAAVDVNEWIRYFAVNALISNLEGGITTNKGEDYYIGQQSPDSRFILLPWDLDEALYVPYYPINAQQVPSVRRFLSYPPFAVQYRAELKHQLDTLFSPQSIQAVYEKVKNAGEPEDLSILHDSLIARPHEVRAQLPERIRLTVRKPGPRYIIPIGASWKLFYRTYPPKGAPLAWTRVEYSDTAQNEWYDASMPFGYSPRGLLGEKGKGSYIPPRADSDGEVTFYVRRRFTWSESRQPHNLRLLMRASAGYVVYINGSEVHRYLLPKGPITQTTRAIAMNPETTPFAIDLRPYAHLFRDGENVIAIESHMTSRSDPRRVLDAVLVEGGPQVGTVVLQEPNLKFAGEAPVPPISNIQMTDLQFPVDPWTADWSGQAHLNPGWNHFTFTGQNANGDSVSTSTVSWYYSDKATRAPLRIDKDTVWTAKDSPYLIPEVLEIAPAATLHLEKGTVVVLDPWANIICRGTLSAEGTAANPVTITGLDASADWGSIIGSGAKSSITLQYTNISGSSNEVGLPDPPRGYTLAGIEMWGGRLEADHCVVKDATGAAFGGGGGAEVLLRDCRMVRTGAGFMSWNSGWTLENCVVLHTRNKGDGIDIDEEGPRRGLAKYCVFADLADDGIDFGGCSARVENCVVWGAHDKGISLDGGGHPEFVNCLIGDADMALGVKRQTKVHLQQSALLASRDGVVTLPPEGKETGGEVQLDDCFVARCQTAFQGGPGSIALRNVFTDAPPNELTPKNSPVKGKAISGLEFANPKAGDWTVTAPMRGTANSLIGLHIVTLESLARHEGVTPRETGLRLLNWE